MKWTTLIFFTKKDGQTKEITYNFRENGIILDNLSYKIINKEKTYNKGDKIIIDINDFNGISYTCATFIQQLYSFMPRQ